MNVSRTPRGLALLTSATLLASLIGATVATPVSAAKPKCAGQTATIVGTKKADVIRGTNKRDVIVAKGGNDVIIGGGGNDIICGGPGNDRLVGKAGLDRLIAGGGSDRLFGGPGPDRLFGGLGPDTLAGQPGNDVLDGGQGTDTCHQGLGNGPAVRCELPSQPPAPTPTPDLRPAYQIACEDHGGTFSSVPYSDTEVNQVCRWEGITNADWLATNAPLSAACTGFMIGGNWTSPDGNPASRSCRAPIS